MKKILDMILFGLFIGSFGFVAMLFIASAITGSADTFFAQKTGGEWLKVAGSFLIIATGFSIPSIVYTKENLSIGLKVLIHMAVGTIVYLIIAFCCGWVKTDFISIVIYILVAIVIAAIFWGIYMMCFKLQANKINKKIKEKQQNDNH